MQTLFRAAAACTVLALTAAATPAAAREGFYRTPALRGDTVVFTAEGDLWRVGTAGGRAERITTHPDLETRPAISPDGRWLAFNGAYERAGEAYRMPLAGGLPQRLTWAGQNPRVLGHTPAGEVLVAAPTLRGEPVTQLFALNPQTGQPRALPVGQATDGALSADGATLYFTRGGLRGDNSRGYRGGQMPRIWRIALAGEAEAQPLLPADAGSSQPMPYQTALGPRVAFLFDRDGRNNLWSVDASGGDLRQHTRHRDWDVRSAAIDGTRVVYALGADLWLLDLAADAPGSPGRRLEITLGGDADHQRQRWVGRAQSFPTSIALAPDGQRVVLNLRGRLATQGTGLLRRAELPVPPDARCRDGVFSHDNRQVFALCDIATAGLVAGELPETEVWRFNADGSGSPVQVTRGATLRRVGLFPSPDGRWLAHGDRAGRIALTPLVPALPATGGRDSQVVDAPRDSVVRPNLAWAPDSQSFAFMRPEGDINRDRLFLHHLPSKRTLALTSDRYDSASPAFTPDGRWLYFLSDRHFASLNASPWGDRNLGPYFDRRTRVYALALQDGLRWPFLPPDELQPATAEPPGAAAPPAAAAPAGSVSAPAASARAAAAASAPAASTPPAKPAAPPKTPPIQLEGLAARLFEVPLPSGNFTFLRTDGRRLYLLEADTTPERRTSLRTVAIDNLGAPPELFAADVNAFDLSSDGKRLLLERRAASGPQPGDIQLLDAAAKAPADAAVLARSQVRWADAPFATDPRAEWRQMFDDAWRLHRDHFYDAGMHGIDWAAKRRQYGALLPRVAERGELNELLAQMVSELSLLHSQVFTTDLRRGADDIAAAGLGARLQRVAEGFRVEHIYRSDPELPSEASPLVAARVQPGDVITQFNGRSVAAAAGVADLGELLRGQAGRQVLLVVKPGKPGGASGSPDAAVAAERRVVLQPLTAQREAQLRMGDWETGNRERAAARSQGRVGYLRLRSMVGSDIASFARDFYAQVDREALIIDVRSNNGGSIDSWIIEKLLRRTWALWQRRFPEGAAPVGNMQQSFRGHLAVLIDENTYSDGETFAEGVKRLGLGTLIGRRTAGAGVWLSDSNRLADGGLMRAAETGQFVPGEGWIIEGRGVAPDIEVDNPPRATFAGGDAQLDAAVDHLQRRLAEQPRPLPPRPPAPRPFVAPLPN
jgi:tricorn protease